MFHGFPLEGMQFLKKLQRNNTKEWFQANKATYDSAVRAPMVALVTELNEALAGFAPAYQAKLPGGVSRPNKDVRFSKDKSPYRTDISAVFPRTGLEKFEAAGFFLRVAPEGVQVLGGAYIPGPEQLKAARAWLDRRHPAFRKTVTDKALVKAMGALQGDQLKRVPKGFDPDHPAGDFLRMTQYYFSATLPSEAAGRRQLASTVAAMFKTMTPFVTLVDTMFGNE